MGPGSLLNIALSFIYRLKNLNVNRTTNPRSREDKASHIFNILCYFTGQLQNLKNCACINASANDQRFVFFTGSPGASMLQVKILKNHIKTSGVIILLNNGKTGKETYFKLLAKENNIPASRCSLTLLVSLFERQNETQNTLVRCKRLR